MGYSSTAYNAATYTPPQLLGGGSARPRVAGRVLDIRLKKVSGGIDDQYRKTSTRVYQVQATPDTDEFGVIASLGIAIFSLHPSYTRAICTAIDAELASDTLAFFSDPTNPANPDNGAAVLVWNLTVRYGPWNPLEHTDTGDPVDQPPEVSIEGVTFEKAVDMDINGVPVLNSAGDYFDPPVTKDEARVVIRITKNFASFTGADVLAYSNKTNGDVFYGYPIHSLKVAPPRAQQLFSQFTGSTYTRVEFQLEFNPDGWKKKVINLGLRQLGSVGGSEALVPILFGGVPATAPALLDEDGHALAPPVTKDNVLVLEFDIYEELDFTSTFALPPTLQL